MKWRLVGASCRSGCEACQFFVDAVVHCHKLCRNETKIDFGFSLAYKTLSSLAE